MELKVQKAPDVVILSTVTVIWTKSQALFIQTITNYDAFHRIQLFPGRIKYVTEAVPDSNNTKASVTNYCPPSHDGIHFTSFRRESSFFTTRCQLPVLQWKLIFPLSLCSKLWPPLVSASTSHWAQVMLQHKALIPGTINCGCVLCAWAPGKIKISTPEAR